MSFRVTGMDLSGYMVQDAPRAIAFYRDVLGLEPVRYYPEDRGAEYELSDGATFGLWNGGDMMPWQPSNGALLAIDDLDAAVAAVKARGLQIHMEHESPVCFMAMIEDSEGNRLVL
ncbi:MAG: VOC family protein, partial [Candidatus Eremiobacteraeota bacterium]|nr:VOC family protein [Candidatus Eremiobacteraeota bacterium]